MAEPIVLCWDIDGTLLTTGRAGIYAWEEAVLEVAGEKIDLNSLNTAGLTDVEISSRLIQTFHTNGNERLARQTLTLYEEKLPESLFRQKGRVMPGVIEILKDVSKREGVHSILLTGNTEAGARAKLNHYGLKEFFEFGAFSDNLPDRPSIAKKALSLIQDFNFNIPSENIYVIGDTEHDIHCGKAIGAKTIAVATGTYGMEELARHQPWHLFESLSDHQFFLKVIGVPRQPIP